MTGLGRAGSVDIRLTDGVISQVSAGLKAEENEETVDATDCVVYPAWVNTHHHLFQTVMKGIPGGIDAALREWLVAVPSRYRGGVDAQVLRISARLGMV